MSSLTKTLVKKARKIGDRVRDRLYSLDSSLLQYANKRACIIKGFYDVDNIHALGGFSTVALNLVTIPFSKKVGFPILSAFMFSCLGDTPEIKAGEEQKPVIEEVRPVNSDYINGLGLSFTETKPSENVNLSNEAFLDYPFKFGDSYFFNSESPETKSVKSNLVSSKSLEPKQVKYKPVKHGGKNKRIRLSSENLESAGTINPGDKIHEIVYDSDKGRIKVPEGDYFVRIGSDFYRNSDDGFIYIPTQIIDEGMKVRFGSESLNESFRGKIGFADEGSNERLPPFRKRKVYGSSDSLETELVSLDLSSGVGVGLESKLRATNLDLDEEGLGDKKRYVSLDILNMYNNGDSASKIIDTYALSTQEVIDTLGDTISTRNKYAGKNFTEKDSLVYFNQRLLDSLGVETDSGKVSFDDYAYDLVRNKGYSFEDAAQELRKYTSTLERDGRAMNITVARVRRWAGHFTEKEYYDDPSIKDKFDGKKVTVSHGKRMTISFDFSKDN